MKRIHGVRYGKLTVIRPSHQNKENRWIWECRCDCGETAFAAKNQLDYGAKKSCGCSSNTKPNLSHGMRSAPEYNIWGGMKDRCLNRLNKDYSNYGGRGIGICNEWTISFEAFYSAMGDQPEGKTLDRIDNDGAYKPSNCRWATPTEQANNRRDTKFVEYEGEIMTLRDLSELVALPQATLYSRIFNHAWSVSRATTEVLICRS